MARRHTSVVAAVLRLELAKRGVDRASRRRSLEGSWKGDGRIKWGWGGLGTQPEMSSADMSTCSWSGVRSPGEAILVLSSLDGRSEVGGYCDALPLSRRHGVLQWFCEGESDTSSVPSTA